mmetsp:Transcript_28949/g.72719  ORF Transcript_28949/g.72719 Transcript_28949/m.72719 type:complete len:158 (+) Transcript_28949:355-828(+)
MRPWLPLTAAAANPMLKLSETMKGWLFEQVVAVPPWHTDATLGSKSTLPVLASHERTGLLTLPLFGHEQLGLQQSQYPVVYVPVTQLESEAGAGVGVGLGVGAGVFAGIGAGVVGADVGGKLGAGVAAGVGGAGVGAEVGADVGDNVVGGDGAEVGR